MLYEEFLRGTNNEDRGHLESVWAAYEFLNKRYMGDDRYLRTKEDCYKCYLENYRHDFDWIDDPDIGLEWKIENTCKRIISAGEATNIINEWFGFERDKIIICGKAYYEATDWNYIRFIVKGYTRVLWNDRLYDVWR
jgi:hypothetical protein